jgi:outer membrane protein OmpA-like peptidoglycan-associated protein
MKKLLTLSAMALALGGCATKEFVNEQVSASSTAANQRMDGQRAELSGRLDKQARDTDERLNGQKVALDAAAKTAAEALERARAAGKLAEGKFVYTGTLSGQVAFPFDGNELTASGKKALDEFAARIKAENKNVFIEIQGHTDNLGPAFTNLKMGEHRAEAVRRYLAVQHGFPLHRMNAMSYGEAAPVADNRTAQGRAENRRVALVVLM